MTTNEPTVREWQRTMAASAQGHENLGGLWDVPARRELIDRETLTRALGPVPDPVSLPPHYRHLPVECIDVAEHFSFAAGNAIKYLWRHMHKGNPIQDLEKAAWYVNREIERLKRDQ